MNELYDFIIILRIVYIDFKDLNNQAALNTLKVFINLIVINVFKFEEPSLYTIWEFIISKFDIKTTIPLSKFVIS